MEYVINWIDMIVLQIPIVDDEIKKAAGEVEDDGKLY